MDAKSPHVVCIIVNWNGWADTLNCLESFKTNLYDNVSLILVDNGSTNDSVSRIRSAFPALEIIESKANLGFGSGNNLGIRHALERGAKYVWLLNNDTIIRPDTLPELVKTAEADLTMGAVGSVLHYLHAPNAIQAWGGGHVNLWMGTSHHFHEPVPSGQIDFITAASILLPAKVLRQVGLFDEHYFMYWEDTDLCFRIRQAGWRLGVAEKAIVLHKEGASSGARNPQFDRWVTIGGVIFLKQYAPFPSISCFMMIFPRALKRFLLGEWARGWAILNART